MKFGFFNINDFLFVIAFIYASLVWKGNSVFVVRKCTNPFSKMSSHQSQADKSNRVYLWYGSGIAAARSLDVRTERMKRLGQGH